MQQPAHRSSTKIYCSSEGLCCRTGQDKQQLGSTAAAAACMGGNECTVMHLMNNRGRCGTGVAEARWDMQFVTSQQADRRAGAFPSTRLLC